MEQNRNRKILIIAIVLMAITIIFMILDILAKDGTGKYI